MTHPEELLAEYVDGSLEQDERAVVEAHLAGCERCRDEVTGARRAREALVALPEVELPEGFRADRRARRVRPAAARHERLRRTVVAVGAAAASIAAIAGVAVLIGDSGRSSSSPSAASGAGHVSASTAYDKARVDHLAASLATSAAKEDQTFSQNSSGALTKTPASSPGRLEPEPTVPPRSSVRCIRAAGDIPPSARPIQTIPRATFNGAPVSIRAYRVGSSIRVVVASRSDCSVLYTTSRPFR